MARLLELTISDYFLDLRYDAVTILHFPYLFNSVVSLSAQDRFASLRQHLGKINRQFSRTRFGVHQSLLTTDPSLRYLLAQLRWFRKPQLIEQYREVNLPWP